MARPASFASISICIARAGFGFGPMLFVFAWSSVTLLDKTGAYDWTMGKLFDYPIEQYHGDAVPAARRRMGRRNSIGARRKRWASG